MPKKKVKTETPIETKRSVPCASCPFLQRNFDEFNAVAKKLSAKHNQPEPDFFQCLTIRERVVADAIRDRRLACHQSVYDGGMDIDITKAVPCAGLQNYLAERVK